MLRHLLQPLRQRVVIKNINFMKKYLLIILTIIPILGFVLMPAAQTVNADGLKGDATKNLQSAGREPYDVQPNDNGPELSAVVGKIINTALTLLGAIFLILIIYGGFKWMTAGGDPGKVEKEMDIIKNSLIGLVIVLGAYAITTFVLGRVLDAVTGS